MIKTSSLRRMAIEVIMLESSRASNDSLHAHNLEGGLRHIYQPRDHRSHHMPEAVDEENDPYAYAAQKLSGYTSHTHILQMGE